MYARRGEVQASKAAAAEDVPFALSTVGICSVEEVAEKSVPPWFQLYMIKDRGYMRELLARVADAGSPVLLFTVDLPTPGARYRDLRSGMMDKKGLAGAVRQMIDGLTHPFWLTSVYLGGRPHRFGNLEAAIPAPQSFAGSWEWIRNNFDLSVTWRDLDFIRESWSGSIVIKGILDVDDARAAASMGFDGIVVSNHGGRQLDGVRASIDALPDIADACGDKTTILVDGGIRSGLDVLKALALGAKACLLGKSWAYALSAGGEKEVRRMLQIVRSELRTAMILAGCASTADVTPDVLDRSA
jgi:L-lactate dehydrogenase (cytochrome)